jgi:NAD-dependent dihydropyrimidine dehydrogenase PreA subunit
MAKADFQVPELKQYAEIPAIEPGVMSHAAPFKAKEEFQVQLGFPGTLPDDWQSKAIGKMGDLLGRYRSLRVYLDSCVKCGSCTDKCHYYLGTKDPNRIIVMVHHKARPETCIGF